MGEKYPRKYFLELNGIRMVCSIYLDVWYVTYNLPASRRQVVAKRVLKNLTLSKVIGCVSVCFPNIFIVFKASSWATDASKKFKKSILEESDVGNTFTPWQHERNTFIQRY